jgi:hypothetical protein
LPRYWRGFSERTALRAAIFFALALAIAAAACLILAVASRQWPVAGGCALVAGVNLWTARACAAWLGRNLLPPLTEDRR